MPQVTFHPSGRSVIVEPGTSILQAAERAGEKLSAECNGRGACGRCLVQIRSGRVPDYRVLAHRGGFVEVLACLTPVQEALEVAPVLDTKLPKLVARDRDVGVVPLAEWAPWPLRLDPIVEPATQTDLGAAVDIGTTTLRVLVVGLGDGKVVGEAGAYNPQIPRGADVISRIVVAEKGGLGELSRTVRTAVAEMTAAACADGGVAASAIRGYVVAGNVAMIHLLLGADPAGIRRVPSEPVALAFDPVPAHTLSWPGADTALVHTMPAVGGWVGGDIVAGVVRIGMSRLESGMALYVDLGTNGEVVFGGKDFAVACACSAGPAFEGGGIRCGMRADRGAVDGARIDPEKGTLEVSVIGGGAPRGICGSGLIGLADALLGAGWLDRSGRLTARVPERYRKSGQWGEAVAVHEAGKVLLYERDLASLVRAKGAIFAGIRTLRTVLGSNKPASVIVSGNFGRFLNLPAAMGIGLLPRAPGECYRYVGNGALEGAALALLSREFAAEVQSYQSRITYTDLSELAGYMDEFVAACFLPHTDPRALEL